MTGERALAAAIAAVVLVLWAGAGEAGTLSFREGDGKGSTSQTDDAWLHAISPDANDSIATKCVVDGSPDQQHCVLKFPNIFGGGVDQIPPGSTVLNATLTMFVTNVGTDCPIVYQLTEGWTEAEVTWNSRATALPWTSPGAEGLGSHKPLAEGILPCTTLLSSETVDVTRSVQSWSHGEANDGWVIVNNNSSDGVDISSSEEPIFAERPMLTVSFVPTAFYSVGTNPWDLKKGSPTISISGSTATLSVPQTGNVGVGDVIDYDTPTQLAYIAVVTSPTEFQVQRADGSAPGATPAIGVNSIRRAFNTIGDAVSDSRDGQHLGTADLAGAFKGLTWVLYNDGPFREEVVIDGYATAPDYHATLTVAGASQVASRTSQRHRGTAGTGAVLRPQDGNGIESRDDHLVIEWLEIDGRENGGSNRRGIDIDVEGSNVLVRNVLVHHFLGGNATALRARITGAEFRNCVVYASEIGIELENDVGMTARNCTVYDSGIDGLRANSSTGNVVQNVISMGSVGEDFAAIGGGGFAVFDNNMSSDSTAGAFGGTGHLVSEVPAAQFVSLVGPLDLHLRLGAAAIDAGIDLSASFGDDIDEQARPHAVTWDMGADESLLSATGTNYRSIGTELPYGTGAVDVASLSDVVSGVTTAWLANNRGRGDVITIPCGDPPFCSLGTDYTILAVDSDTSLRLAQAYLGPTTPGESYLIRRQFATLQEWESCISGAGGCVFFPVAGGDLVLEDRSEVGIAYEDSVFALTADVQIDGSTTDALHTITLTADGRNRHYGVPGDGVIVDGQGNPNGIVVRDFHVTLEWLELVRVTGVNDKAAVLVEGAGQTSLLFQNLLIHDFFDGSNDVAGINLDNSGGGGRTVTVRNTMIWDGDEEGIQGGLNSDTLTIENRQRGRKRARPRPGKQHVERADHGGRSKQLRRDDRHRRGRRLGIGGGRPGGRPDRRRGLGLCVEPADIGRQGLCGGAVPDGPPARRQLRYRGEVHDRGPAGRPGDRHGAPIGWSDPAGWTQPGRLAARERRLHARSLRPGRGPGPLLQPGRRLRLPAQTAGNRDDPG